MFNNQDISMRDKDEDRFQSEDGYYNRFFGSILPPYDNWKCANNLPYGWEMALHQTGRVYFLNHINREVSWKHPNENLSPVFRHFSHNSKLLHQPNHFYITSKKIEVKPEIKKPKNKRLFASKLRKKKVKIEIDNTCQIATKQCFPSCFTKTSTIMQNPRMDAKNTATVLGTFDLYLEDRPEDVQIFCYYSNTTASDLLLDLCHRRDLSSKFFSLVMTSAYRKSPHGGAIELLNDVITAFLESENLQEGYGRIVSVDDNILIAPWDLIPEIALNPRLSNHRCRLRLIFLPKDLHQMALEDPSSFLYLYRQSVRDVRCNVRLQSELHESQMIELRAIQIVESSMCFEDEEQERTLVQKSLLDLRKSLIRMIEKQSQDVSFMPSSKNEMNSLRKSLQNSAKSVMDASLAKTSCSKDRLRRLRMDYLKILSPCHYFGGSCYDVVIQGKTDHASTIVVGRHYGISELINPKTQMLSAFCSFDDVLTLDVAPEDTKRAKTNVRVEMRKISPLILALDSSQALSFSLFIFGYSRLASNSSMMLILALQHPFLHPDLPAYKDLHQVFRSGWNDPTSASDSPLFLCKFSDHLNLISPQSIPINIRELAQESLKTSESLRSFEDISITSDDVTTSISSTEKLPQVPSNIQTIPKISSSSVNQTSTFKPGQPLAGAVVPSSSSRPHVIGAELTWDEDQESVSSSKQKRRSRFFPVHRKPSNKSYSIDGLDHLSDDVARGSSFSLPKRKNPSKAIRKRMSRIYSPKSSGVISRIFSKFRKHKSSYDLNLDDDLDKDQYVSYEDELGDQERVSFLDDRRYPGSGTEDPPIREDSKSSFDESADIRDDLTDEDWNEIEANVKKEEINSLKDSESVDDEDQLKKGLVKSKDSNEEIDEVSLDSNKISVEGVSVEKVVVEEVPVEEVPVEEIPVEELLVEEIPVEEVHVEEVPVEEVPVEEIPVEELLVEEIPVEEVPVEEVPVEEVPVKEVFVNEIPVKEVPVEEVPVKEVPVKKIPSKEVLVEEIPVKEVSVEELLVEEIPVKEVPVEEVSVEEVPVKEVLVEEIPVKEVPVKEVPVEEVPVEEASVEEVPMEEAPVEEVPVEEIPVKEIPVEEVPVEEAPVEEIPMEEASVEEVANDKASLFQKVLNLEKLVSETEKSLLLRKEVLSQEGEISNSYQSESSEDQKTESFEDQRVKSLEDLTIETDQKIESQKISVRMEPTSQQLPSESSGVLKINYFQTSSDDSKLESSEPKTESSEPKTESSEPKTESSEPKTESSQPKTESSQPKTESSEPKTESSDDSKTESSDFFPDLTEVDSSDAPKPSSLVEMFADVITSFPAPPPELLSDGASSNLPSPSLEFPPIPDLVTSSPLEANKPIVAKKPPITLPKPKTLMTSLNNLLNGQIEISEAEQMGSRRSMDVTRRYGAKLYNLSKSVENLNEEEEEELGTKKYGSRLHQIQKSLVGLDVTRLSEKSLTKTEATKRNIDLLSTSSNQKFEEPKKATSSEQLSPPALQTPVVKHPVIKSQPNRNSGYYSNLVTPRLFGQKHLVTGQSFSHIKPFSNNSNN